MEAPRTRAVVFAVLLAAGASAGLLAWDGQQRAGGLLRAERDVATRLDAVADTTARLAAAQHAYVAPGQPDAPWLDRFSSLVPALTAQLAGLRPLMPSDDAAASVDRVAAGAASLADIDARARAALLASQDQAAADLIFSEALETVDAMTASVGAAREAERRAFDRARTADLQRAWMALGAAGILWIVGLALLARTPRPSAIPSPAVVVTQAEGSPRDVALTPATDGLPVPATDMIDLAAVADLCTALSRLTSTVALPDLLVRAAVALDASGIIIWMGAGEELFAVTAHGYDPRVISRLGPISRNADNATAACWRTGELSAVAGSAVSNGAIVAPMFWPDSCVGVLSAEVRRGREKDSSTRAVTAMIAAQLATVIAAWPAGQRRKRGPDGSRRSLERRRHPYRLPASPPTPHAGDCHAPSRSRCHVVRRWAARTARADNGFLV